MIPADVVRAYERARAANDRITALCKSEPLPDTFDREYARLDRDCTIDCAGFLGVFGSWLEQQGRAAAPKSGDAYDWLDTAFRETVDDLCEAQRALVLLANEFERRSIPFLPAAEAATAKARLGMDHEDRLIATGLKAAAGVYHSRHKPATA